MNLTTKPFGTINRGGRKVGVEGTVEEVREDRRHVASDLIVRAARSRREWTEIAVDVIEHRRSYVADTSTGRLYDRVRGTVLAVVGGEEGRSARAQDVSTLGVVAFYVTDGSVVFLAERSRKPLTVADLDEVDAKRTADAEAAATRERTARNAAASALRARLEKQPVAALTVGDLTVAEAWQVLADHACRVEVRDGRLWFEGPARFAGSLGDEADARKPVDDAVAVLVAARDVVVEVLQSRSAKDVAERLPARRVGPDGALVTS